MVDLLDALDVALLQSASRWSLDTKHGRKASAAWLSETYGKVLLALKPEVFWELGAFDAAFSRQLRGSMRKTVYHAFEANPYNYEQFNEAVRKDGVKYHHLALGPEDGETTFNIGRRLSDRVLEPVAGSNSVLTKSGDRDYEEVTVKMVTLDSFAAEHQLTGRPSAVWVDTEGFAYQVLLGMRQTLKSSSCVFVEVEDRQLWQDQKTAVDVRRFLFKEGFIPILRDFEFSHQYNVLFVRPRICERADVRLILTLALQASAAG
jgi:FkbM family methyltransferase